MAASDTQLSPFAERVEDVRRAGAASLDTATRSKLGQFFTPASVARLMARMFDALPQSVRLLDAGAGTGALAAAFIDEACGRSPRAHDILATLFELDPVLRPHIDRTLDECRSCCRGAGVRLKTAVGDEDFIEAAVGALRGGLFADRTFEFDAAILNPPYGKIAMQSRERFLLGQLGLRATNLYAAFVSLAIRALAPAGQIVAIVPRSFCNGPYFRAFRNQILAETEIRRVHVFGSREAVFAEDAILQENVILHLVRCDGRRRERDVAVVSSLAAGPPHVKQRVPYDQVVRVSNGDRFIHLPTSEADHAVARWVQQLPDTLESLGIRVSTGRVVDFRAREHLRAVPSSATAPLIHEFRPSLANPVHQSHHQSPPTTRGPRSCT